MRKIEKVKKNVLKMKVNYTLGYRVLCGMSRAQTIVHGISTSNINTLKARSKAHKALLKPCRREGHNLKLITATAKTVVYQCGHCNTLRVIPRTAELALPA